MSGFKAREVAVVVVEAAAGLVLVYVIPVALYVLFG